VNGITVITPTGDRPLAFGLLRDRWMKNQIMKPDQWIIVDDGDTPYGTDGLPEYAHYIRKEKSKNESGYSIGRNLLAALSEVKCDDVLIMEDDDWYSNGYIFFMHSLLEQCDLVGLWGTNYYNVKVPGYREMGKNTHASLSQTAFNKSFIPNLIKSIPGNISIDLRLWKNNTGLLKNGRDLKLHCSIKGMPGRENAGIGGLIQYYKLDKDYLKLVQWCDDAEVYIDLMERKFV